MKTVKREALGVRSKDLVIMVCSSGDRPDPDLMMMVCKDLGGVVPAEIQVIPAGFHHTRKGDFICDEESAALVLAEFESQTNDMVMDYEHQSLEVPPVEAPAAGWIKQLINKGADGIWAVMEWTEKARQYIQNKEYRYVSPVFLKRKTDNKVVLLFNVALTNNPNIDGMVPLINKREAFNVNRKSETEKEEGTMFKELLKLLGLSETATEADAIVAVNKLKTEAAAGTTVVANRAVLTALGLEENASESAVVATVMANKQAMTMIEGLTAQVNSLTAELQKKDVADVETMVNKAVSDGKISPAQKDWALDYAKRDIEGFKIFVAKAPGVIAPGKVVDEPGADKGASLDAAQLQINRLMGVDAETYKKFSPKEEGR